MLFKIRRRPQRKRRGPVERRYRRLLNRTRRRWGRRACCASEAENECGRQTSDYCGNKEALGGDRGGEGGCGGCSCRHGSGGGVIQGSAREGSGVSQEGWPYCGRAKGAVHRDEETVGGEKEGGGKGESGLTTASGLAAP